MRHRLVVLSVWVGLVMQVAIYASTRVMSGTSLYLFANLSLIVTIGAIWGVGQLAAERGESRLFGFLVLLPIVGLIVLGREIVFTLRKPQAATTESNS